MEIKACPKCGSTKIYQGTMGDGVLTGYTSRQVCRNCGYQGMPLIFNNEKDYKKFLEGLKKEQTEKPSKEQKLKQSSRKDQTRPKGLFFLSAILIAETISALYLFSMYPPLIQSGNVPGIMYLSMFVLTGIFVPIGILTKSTWTFTLAGILFIFTIPINLPLLYYITRPHVKNYLLKKKPDNQRN
ncbi:MAG TPA: hypothetical protein VKP59_06755 [Candidatus Thermoplasmatota archaeon]|nr:hypothetical protein [Candidatus Thermoplasmatota archaeon]